MRRVYRRNLSTRTVQKLKDEQDRVDGHRAAGMLLLGLLGTTLWPYYAASVLIGFGLASLLGAPIRYIMLAEAPPEDRAAAQGAVTIFTGVGQLLSGALVGAVAASVGGGAAGYQLAYIVCAAIAGLLLLLALGLRGRAATAVRRSSEQR